MKAKSLMTAALAISLLFVSTKAFADNVKLQDLKSISVLGPAGHGPRGVPFEHINLSAALNDRVHGYAWGTLLDHNKPENDEKHGRPVVLRRNPTAASGGRELVLVFLVLPGDPGQAVPSVTVPGITPTQNPTTIPSVTPAAEPVSDTTPVTTVEEVPEPATIVLLGTSLTLLAAWRLLRKPLRD